MSKKWKGTLVLPHPKNMLHRQLIQPLISISPPTKALHIKRSRLNLACKFFAIPLTNLIQERRVCSISTINLLQQLLNLEVGIKTFGFRFENVVGAHASCCEVPYALGVFCTI